MELKFRFIMINQSTHGLTDVKNAIQHQGVITKVTPKKITVALQGNIHCETCNAKSACGTAEADQKEVEITHTSALNLHDEVTVLLRKDVGMKAVFWAYLFPFILLMTVLIASSYVVEEWLSGVLAILVLLPYYLMLHFLQKRFKKSFQFSILKTSS